MSVFDTFSLSLSGSLSLSLCVKIFFRPLAIETIKSELAIEFFHHPYDDDDDDDDANLLSSVEYVDSRTPAM